MPEGPCRDHVDVVLLRQRQGERLGRGLRQRVGVDGADRGVLRDPAALGLRAVDLAAADHQHPRPRCDATHRLEHVPGTGDVDSERLERLLEGARGAGLAGEVNEGIGLRGGDHSLGRDGIEDVAGVPCLEAGRWARAAQAASVDPRARRDQRARQVGADESVGAGDQHGGAVERLHRSRCPGLGARSRMGATPERSIIASPRAPELQHVAQRLLERDGRLPSGGLLELGRVAEQDLHVAGTQPGRVLADLDLGLAHAQ